MSSRGVDRLMVDIRRSSGTFSLCRNATGHSTSQSKYCLAHKGCVGSLATGRKDHGYVQRTRRFTGTGGEVPKGIASPHRKMGSTRFGGIAYIEDTINEPRT